MLLICYCRIQHCFQTKIIGENVGGGTLNFPAKKQACFEICAQKIPISENSNSKRRGGGGEGGEGGRGGMAIGEVTMQLSRTERCICISLHFFY